MRSLTYLGFAKLPTIAGCALALGRVRLDGAIVSVRGLGAGLWDRNAGPLTSSQIVTGARDEQTRQRPDSAERGSCTVERAAHSSTRRSGVRPLRIRPESDSEVGV